MKECIEKFYSSFNSLDAEGMVDCYHDDIIFEDPAFGRLNGEEAKQMWRMLTASQSGGDFKVTLHDVEADQENGSARWEAIYLFSRTGRKVHNIIHAKFKFKDGLIVDHRDDFDLHRWSRQALGFKGMLLGGTTFFRKKLQAQCRGLLDKYMNKVAVSRDAK
jgi:ketosteroid isomerase-like protein